MKGHATGDSELGSTYPVASPYIGQGHPTSRDSPTLPGERGAAPQAGRWRVTERGDAIGFHLG